mgnify:CR=1 FL=1|tara:strand:- start:695 stop:1069 length:375 start_codon:yes stop_codon:yes gene_type:complete
MSFEFKHPTKYKKSNINIDKAIAYPERELDKKGIMKLASETGAEEFELDLTTGLLEEFEKWKEENSGSFRDFLSTKRQKLGAGGDVESLADLYDAYEKGIDVMPGEDVSSYIKRIRAAEKKASS